MTTTTAQKWMCESCGFIYDPAEGDPDGGIPPGTALDDIPSDWFCPVCGARKADFSPYEEWVDGAPGPGRGAEPRRAHRPPPGRDRDRPARWRRAPRGAAGQAQPRAALHGRRVG